MSKAFAATGGLVVLALIASGCGAVAHRDAEAGPSAMGSPSVAPKHYAHGTGQLRMTISPARGRVGTKVTITATRCGDPDGRNHAVSFNPGFGNTMQAAQARYPQDAIPSRLTGQTLTATYTVTPEDARAATHTGAAPPMFYVQCSDDLATATFHLVGATVSHRS